MAKRGDPIDGVMLFDKPYGMSSNAALQTVRRRINAQKAGHTGTLDPMAKGLLASFQSARFYTYPLFKSLIV